VASKEDVWKASETQARAAQCGIRFMRMQRS